MRVPAPISVVPATATWLKKFDALAEADLWSDHAKRPDLHPCGQPRAVLDNRCRVDLDFSHFYSQRRARRRNRRASR